MRPSATAIRHLLPVLLAVVALLQACRLDDELFNPERIDAYLLDAYPDERELDDLPTQDYAVPPHLIHPFTYTSYAEGEQATIYAFYLGNVDSIGVDTVIMYCHGNRGHMDYYWNRAKLLAHAGGAFRYGVLMIDYRGFGMSTGSPSEEGLYADVAGGLSWLHEHGLTEDRLVMYGYSLGSAPATKLTAEPRGMRAKKLILEAPFANAEVMVQDATGLALPGSYFTSLEINNAEEIRSVHAPFCWIHGIDDDFLNIDTHGEVVYANHPGPMKEAHRIAGAQHNDVPKAMGYGTYATMLADFIRRP